MDDGAHRLGVVPPLGVGGAGVRWSSSSGEAAALRCEFPREGRHAVLHVSLRGGEVVVLVPGQCSTQATHLEYKFKHRFTITFSCGSV